MFKLKFNYRFFFSLCFFSTKGDKNLDKMINLSISQSLVTFNVKLEDHGSIVFYSKFKQCCILP
jgi:hypothetical protein